LSKIVLYLSSRLTRQK